MVKFVEKDPAEVEDYRQGRKGRISYSLIKSFLETGMRCAQLDASDVAKKPDYLKMLLKGYVKRHDMPIEVFLANGDVHLLRLDLDEDGNKIENWKEYHGLDEDEDEENGDEENGSEPTPLSEEDPSARAGKEKKELLSER